MTKTLMQQVLCRLCGQRRLTLCSTDRFPGERARLECPDCGFVAVQQVVLVVDDDWYGIADPYGPGDLPAGADAERVDFPDQRGESLIVRLSADPHEAELDRVREEFRAFIERPDAHLTLEDLRAAFPREDDGSLDPTPPG